MKQIYNFRPMQISPEEINQISQTGKEEILTEFIDVDGEIVARVLVSDKRAKQDNREEPYIIPGQPPLIIFTTNFCKKFFKRSPVADFRLFRELWNIHNKNFSQNKTEEEINGTHKAEVLEGRVCDSERSADNFAVLYMGIDNTIIALKKLKEQRKLADHKKGITGQPDSVLALREFDLRIQELKELKRKYERLQQI